MMVVPTLPPEPLCPNLLLRPSAGVQERGLPDLQVGACVELARRLRPCFGPRGLAKSRLFRYPRGFSAPPAHSPDTASVLACMSLEDGGARLMAAAAVAQAESQGDGAGLVLLLGGSLLEQARGLLALGVRAEEVHEGYGLACRRALQLMEEGALARSALRDPRSEGEVAVTLRHFLSAREPGLDELLARVAARCCVHSWRPGQGGETFDPSCIRVSKVVGEARPTEESEPTDRQEGGEGKEGDVEEKRENGRQRERTTGEEGELKGHNDRETEGKEMEEKGWVVEDREEKKIKCDQENAVEEGETKAEKRNEEQQNIDQEESDPTGMKDKEEENGKIEEDNDQDEVIGKEEGADEWEEWVDLGLEIDEPRSEGEGEEGEAERKDERETAAGERTEGDGREAGNGRSGGERAAWRRRETAEARLHAAISRLRERCSSPRRVTVRKDGRRTKPRGPQGRLARSSHGRSTLPTDRNRSYQTRTLQASVSTQERADADSDSQAVTVTLRGPDAELLDRAERAVRACLQLYRSLLGEPRLLPGAGLAELGLARELTQYGLGLPGMEQLAVHAFAQALLQPARALAENSGTPPDSAALGLCGVEARAGSGVVLDPLGCKRSALEKATEVALAVLSDQLSRSPEGSAA